MIWIVTDSAQELKSDDARGLAVMNLPLSINGEDVKEEISEERFYELLDDEQMTLRTSQASPAMFEDFFEKLTANGDEVVAILVSTTLSGTYNSARLAALDFPGVHLIDSHTACLAQTVLVERAIELRDQGLSAYELVAALEEEKHQAKLYATLPTLQYLKKGGRISPAKAAIADLAGIKPVLTVNDDGEVEPCAKSRGIKKAIRQCAKLAVEHHIDLERPIVVACSGPYQERAELMLADLEEELGTKLEVRFFNLSPVLGVHLGPGGAGVGFFEKK